MSQCIASLSGRRMAKAEVLEVLGRRPFEARMGLQAAGGPEKWKTHTQFTSHLLEERPRMIFECLHNYKQYIRNEDTAYIYIYSFGDLG